MQQAINAGTFLVSDKWPSTEPAAAKAGLSVVGQVNHNHTFRDADTGFHSNDIESEFGRFETWARKKFCYIRMCSKRTEQDKREHMSRQLAEYVYYTTVGRGMDDIMLAMTHSANASEE